MPGHQGSGDQQALSRGRVPTPRAGLVGRGRRRGGAPRPGAGPLGGRGGRTAAPLAGPVAVVRLAGPRGGALRRSPGAGPAEGRVSTLARGTVAVVAAVP